ncbi:PepSY-associated TM helix domain-containing protein [Vibrio kyushuensis]|uniref:PepSY-associated TM helix domain-containing protein n=1 Tax=Vibrio kyushuensis TaxID=2910249 RepID=UPI003D106A20
MLDSQTQTIQMEISPQSTRQKQAKSRYFLTWRWHFYMGLFVIPFMLMLSLTGLVMLFDDEIEYVRYGDILSVEPQEKKTLASVQIEAVRTLYTDASVTQFVAAHDADVANRVSIRLEDGRSIFVIVDPYTAQILGEIDRSDSWYQLANDIHGTLLIGKWGDHLIEISASLSILLLVTGIYLWLPTDNASKSGFMQIRLSAGKRIVMRDIHANLGGALSIILLLFLLSGLAWAGIWGAKMVQGWNTFPTYYTWGDKPESDVSKLVVTPSSLENSSLNHSSLNHGSEEEMPWNLELTPLPESNVHDHSNHQEDEMASNSNVEPAVSIDTIISKAKLAGHTHFKVFLPSSETGVFTTAANSMAGDIDDPRLDRTIHFDQYSGDVLMDISWQDYSVVAKLMAAGVTLHQGDASIVNKLLNALFCFGFIAISITGGIMWWIRRPIGASKLGVPPRFEQDGIWRVGLGTVVILGLCFPLAGATIIAVCCIDWLVVSRSQRLKHYLA